MATVTPHTEIINDLLRLAVDSGASDIIIKSNKLGYVRLSNKLKPVIGIRLLAPRRRLGSWNTCRKYSGQSGRIWGR